MSSSSKFSKLPISGKVYIASVDDSSIRVTAQYNPKELQVDRTVPWSPTGEVNNTNKDPAKKEGGVHLEFTGTQGRTLTLELLFDEYEGPDAQAPLGESIKNLEILATVRDPTQTKDEFKRPHLCNVVWGSTLQSFQCVIESLTTKYTMFSRSGAPLRATCTVKLREADTVDAKKAAPATPTGTSGTNTNNNPPTG